MLPNFNPTPKLWGYVDFKMAANENALTQPKCEPGINGIIQNVFQGDKTTKQKMKSCWKTINYFPREGYPSVKIQ